MKLDLENEKIGKLIRKFSIPCIISMLVSSLYNIVDQIFIGWGVGYLGNGATNIVFPIVVIALALSLMVGDGASAFMSLKLGEKKKEEAAKGVANGIILSVFFSLVLTFICLIFLPQILNMFGCTDALRKYALSYGRIIVVGLPFFMVSSSLNSIVRADGSPKYSMKSMVSGAVLNLILDPIFIFIFKLGVTGTAIATILSQFFTFVLNLIYMWKIKSITLSKETFNFNFNISKRILLLGISSFITQMSIVVLISVQNNLLVKYGNLSEFGKEIPITVLGIVMKINQILNSVILGIAIGSQPIFGYNYGAKKYERVKETLKTVLKYSLIISTTAFLLFQLFPDKLILIFGSGNDLYIKFACMTFRIYLLLCILNGIQMPTGIFFQAIGKANKSAILSLSRQILFLIPSMIIFGNIYGLKGVLFSGPFADGLAFILAIFFIVKEVKYLNESTSIANTQEPQIAIKNINKKFVITISREYGSGGRYIGKLLAEKLGIKLYDKEIINEISKQTGLSEDFIRDSEQKKYKLDILNNLYYPSNDDAIFKKEVEYIRKKASKETCIIIGRCADYILKDSPNVLKIFVYSDVESKVARATKYYNLDKNAAKKEINKINKLRANHYKYYTGRNWKDFENYDICINSDSLGTEKTAEAIYKLIEEKYINN